MILNEREWKREGELYVVARTSPEEGYSGFAILPIDGVDSKGGPDNPEYHFCGSHKSSLVTWFSAENRRAVLGLFAANPKLYYRCVIVNVKELG